MNKIDFEADQEKMLGKTENIQSLADQVEKLNILDQQVQLLEKDLKQKTLFKDLKKEVEIGANGTQKYVIKKGINKGKVI